MTIFYKKNGTTKELIWLFSIIMIFAIASCNVDNEILLKSDNDAIGIENNENENIPIDDDVNDNVDDIDADFLNCTLGNHEHCAKSEFCRTEHGKCDSLGHCTHIFEKWECENSNEHSLINDYVCGCDSNTYKNECEASKYGVSINYMGKCI